MSANIIDGRELAKQTRIKLRKEIDRICHEGKRPGLAVILVGQNPASQIYVKYKQRDCGKVGIESKVIQLPESTDAKKIISEIKRLNNDDTIHGILLQMPLPEHLNASEIMTYIDEKKDVDGLHVINAGKLFTGQKGLKACTPLGIIKMIDSTGIEIEGKHAVVIGRSNIVGKPMAMMLLERNATVTMCHSRTKNLKQIVKLADIVVAAVGRRNIITADMIKDGAVVIDVAMNRVEGKLYGDVDFEKVQKKASFITPVPGGVGPMTRAMLLFNTLKAFKNSSRFYIYSI